MPGVEDVRAAFGRRVREARQARRLTLEELAHRADLHWTFVSGVERGTRNPGLVSVEKLAVALGLSLRELFEPFGERRRIRGRRT
jgi:transcriptional regulator with XRE-family HTH domain